MYPVTLTGRTVVLRDFRQDDAADAFLILGDDRVTRPLSFDSRSLADTITMIAGILSRAAQEPRTEYYLAVTIPAGIVIGFIRLGLNGVKAAKLGFAINADHWGRGHATDAGQAMLDFGFNTLGLHRISAATAPDNDASIAVLKRLGMSYEGKIRHHVFTNGAWRDSLLFSVLQGEGAQSR